MSFSDFDFNFPVVMTASGAQPTPPATLLAQLIASVSATDPGYTVLPGALIEDISSTAVGALIICDGLRVETINSLTYLGANDFLLLQLGQQFIGDGSAPAPPTNTSVFVIFTATDNSNNTLPGQVISPGFTVSDGTYQYIVQDGGVTGSSGQTEQLFCVASIAGSWAVPTNSVTQIITSPPPNINIACTNPSPGVAASAAETEEQYRARVMQAGRATATGTQNFLKTLLGEVPGVQQNLISISQQTGGGWKIICGGGDPYLTAGAIYASGIDISLLVGSEILVTNISQANPGVVTTNINHGFTTGQNNVEITGIVGMIELNGVILTVTVIDEKNFSVGLNTTGYAPYVSGGIVTPNARNITASLFDYPDSYSVIYVNPPAQTVTMDVEYETILTNFTSQAAVSQLGAPAVAEYVSGIGGPGAPISLLVLEQVFLEAIQSAINPALISSLTITIFINGIETAPIGDLVYGDPESYFVSNSAGINILEG